MKWEDLTPRERDVLVAKELMGGAFETFAGRYGMLDAGGRPMEVPHYSTDIAAAWLVEGEIERQKLGREYIVALLGILDLDDKVPDGFTTGHTYWQVTYASLLYILRATPDQRCLAALRAKGVAV